MRRSRVGFLGVGWIGRNRMEAMIATGAIESAAVCDPNADMAAEAARIAGAPVSESLDAMLDLGLDGIVIASPSALHAGQAIRALERGVAVFCQKPLAHTVFEARQMRRAAEKAGVATQMGNQIQSHEVYRTAVKAIQSGVIAVISATMPEGTVSSAHDTRP